MNPKQNIISLFYDNLLVVRLIIPFYYKLIKNNNKNTLRILKQILVSFIINMYLINIFASDDLLLEEK